MKFLIALAAVTVTVTVTVTVIAAATPALAQTAPGGGSIRQACTADAKKYCADVRPGGGRIIQCLKSHEKDVTPACREALATTKAAK